MPQSLYASWFQAYDGRRGGLFLIVCFLQIGSLLLDDWQLTARIQCAYFSLPTCLLLDGKASISIGNNSYSYVYEKDGKIQSGDKDRFSTSSLLDVIHKIAA